MSAGRRIEASAHGSWRMFAWPEIDFGLIVYYWRPQLPHGGFPVPPPPSVSAALRAARVRAAREAYGDDDLVSACCYTYINRDPEVEQDADPRYFCDGCNERCEVDVA